MTALTNEWWGYKHVNGRIQVKRYFEPRDIEEACASTFVREVIGPFDALDRQDAINIITRKLGHE